MDLKLLMISLVSGVLMWNYAEACTCMPSHPQSQVCKADFVIVAKVRHVIHKDIHTVYRIKIRKEFKTTEKARMALKLGRLLTSSSGSTCGVELERDQTYLIIGKVLNLQAYTNLCHFVKPWSEITPRQRKGFRLLYKQGCNCEIVQCPWYRECPEPAENKCMWNMQRDACQEKHGICLRNAKNQCHWIRNTPQLHCEKIKRMEERVEDP